MLTKDEVSLFKRSWRLFAAFWAVVIAVFGFMYQSGLADYPAAARDVQAIKRIAKGNNENIAFIKRSVQTLTVSEAVTKNNRVNLNRRLGDIENGQREMQQDIKQLLRLFNSQSR